MTCKFTAKEAGKSTIILSIPVTKYYDYFLRKTGLAVNVTRAHMLNTMREFNCRGLTGIIWG